MAKDSQSTRGYKIEKVDRQRERIVVTASFHEGEGEKPKVLNTITHAFPLTATEKEIAAEVKKAAQVFFEDLDRSIENAAREKVEAEADAVSEKLTGKQETL